jgi:glycosyltransferase involved in cell wall biosynthesis
MYDRIHFISYWPRFSGITQSSVIPTIAYLIKQGIANHIFLYTREIDISKNQKHEMLKVSWCPVLIGRFENSGLQLIETTISFLNLICNEPRQKSLIIARGATAGGIAWFISKLTRIPFIVESFEPHSAYMTESGVWPKNSLKARLQRYLEKKQIINACALITVSRAYTELLQAEYKQLSNVYTIPCTVSFQMFNLKHPGELYQNILNAGYHLSADTKIGIYVGQFGDIYYKEEFFELLASLQNQDPNFFQIILTPKPDLVYDLIEDYKINKQQVMAKAVDWTEIPLYLRIADFGICLVRQSKHKRFCSPIKTGEYMAAGLPTLISKDIGDDSEFIEQNNIGWVVDIANKEHLNFILPSKTSMKEAERIRTTSYPFKSRDNCFKVYNQIFT